jgi:hypothetical protein
VSGSLDKKGEEDTIFYQAKGGVFFHPFCLTNPALHSFTVLPVFETTTEYNSNFPPRQRWVVFVLFTHKIPRILVTSVSCINVRSRVTLLPLLSPLSWIISSKYWRHFSRQTISFIFCKETEYIGILDIFQPISTNVDKANKFLKNAVTRWGK